MLPDDITECPKCGVPMRYGGTCDVCPIEPEYMSRDDIITNYVQFLDGDEWQPTIDDVDALATSHIELHDEHERVLVAVDDWLTEFEDHLNTIDFPPLPWDMPERARELRRILAGHSGQETPSELADGTLTEEGS